MLRLVSSVLGLPVMLHHTAQKIGDVGTFVVDPAKGKIEAYEMQGRRKQRYLSTVDVLDYYDDAITARDADALQEATDLVRLTGLLEERTDLLGLRVVSQRGRRLGKVKDALFDTQTHFIAKLYVKPGLTSRLLTSELVIAREQIVAVTPKQVTVRYDEKAAAPGAPAELPSS